MTHTSPLSALRLALALVLLVAPAGCSAIFDGHEYVSSDASARDSAADTGDSAMDSAPPDPCAGACSGETSICDLGTPPTCVQCLVDHDCPAATPACDTAVHQCVECTADNALACGGDTPVCDTAADAGANTCVACNANADCPDSTPVCTDDHTCAGCTAPADCRTRLGKLACDTSSGACVECTATTAATNCSATAICTQGNTCSEFAERTRDACESCDDDANCMAMQRCVPMTYAGAAHGSYCLRLASAGCAQPYSVSNSTASLGGDTGPYCGIDEALATCEAVRGLIDNVACPSGDDAECGDGGLCRTVGVLSQRCTYECSATRQCLAVGTGADTCGDGPTGGASYCGG